MYTRGVWGHAPPEAYFATYVRWGKCGDDDLNGPGNEVTKCYENLMYSGVASFPWTCPQTRPKNPEKGLVTLAKNSHIHVYCVSLGWTNHACPLLILDHVKVVGSFQDHLKMGTSRLFVDLKFQKHSAFTLAMVLLCLPRLPLVAP